MIYRYLSMNRESSKTCTVRLLVTERTLMILWSVVNGKFLCFLTWFSCVAQILVFYVLVCRPLFVLLSLFNSSLYCLSSNKRSFSDYYFGVLELFLDKDSNSDSYGGYFLSPPTNQIIPYLPIYAACFIKNNKNKYQSTFFVTHLVFLRCDWFWSLLFRGRDRMVVGFTTTCAISGYHH